MTWGFGFVTVALTSYLVGLGLGEGDRLRAGLVLAMVAVWGGRLAWHIRKRALGVHAGAEDPRYVKLLGGKVSEVGLGVAVRKVFVVQGVAIWFVSLPVQVAGVADVADDWGWVVPGHRRRGVGDRPHLRGGRRRPAGVVQGDPEGAATAGHGDRAVALHPAPQLLR